VKNLEALYAGLGSMAKETLLVPGPCGSSGNPNHRPLAEKGEPAEFPVAYGASIAGW